jgi:hypothetical protein
MTEVCSNMVLLKPHGVVDLTAVKAKSSAVIAEPRCVNEEAREQI